VTRSRPNRLAFPALLVGNVALAFGPWLVRLADVGAVAAGFWRVFLAIPFLCVIGVLGRQPPRLPKGSLLVTILSAAVFYAFDLAGWNAGIRLTKLANATLFGNVGSFVLVGWGLWTAMRLPSRLQSIALLLAAAGAAMLMGGSFELSPRNFRGDLLTLGAGLLYGGYLIFIERTRTELQPIPTLVLASSFAAPVLLVLSLAFGEQVWPRDWTWLVVLALSSQVLGQGLLVYGLGIFPPIVVGLVLLSQPAVSALIGWFAYGEALALTDWAGAAAIAIAQILVRLPQKALPAGHPRTS
jgi:drug/metabolite transporter (DMT)-like permease